MRFDNIQPLALRLREDAQPLLRNCITLPFPPHWAEGFKKLQAQVSNRPLDKVTVPIASLNRTLRAVVPPIISIGRGVTGQRAVREGKPWLYMHTKIEPAILISVVHSWMRVSFKSAPDEMLNQMLASVQTHDVAWKAEQIDLVSWKETVAGTALHTNPGQFVLFPDQVAATLSSVQEGFQYGDHQLHFRRSSLAPGQRGAELTSWPPLSYGDARYSVVLTFTVQTVPFQPYPVLHCDVSLRRWAGPRRVFLKHRASVYIAASLPFIAELNGWENQLQVASLQRHVRKQEDEWTTQWEDRLVDILVDLRSKVSLIDATKLTKTPFDGHQDWDNAAAIVYSTRMGRHNVGAGVAIPERGRLFDQISGLLDTLFVPASPFQRVKVRKQSKFSFRSTPFLDTIQNDTKRKLTAEQRLQIQKKNNEIWSKRRALVANTVGGHMNIEIRARTAAVRENLVTALRDVLGIQVIGGADGTTSTPEMLITTSFDDLGNLTDNLGVDSGKGVQERVRDATQRRLNEVKQQLSKVELPTLTLAEILPKDKYLKNNDPKSSLRVGLGRSSRLAQFITADGEVSADLVDDSEEDEAVAPLYYRATNAVLDGLRQLGIPGKLPTSTPNGRPCTLIGIWLINKKSSKPGVEGYKLPVLVRMSSTDQTIFAIAPGFDDWLPYRRALLKLSDTDVLHTQNKRANHVAFFQTQLRQLVSPTNDTLLICHAQNLRLTWSWLSNTNILCDAVTFSGSETDDADNHDHKGEIPVPITELPGLRIVRVRDGQSHETPEWFAERDDARSMARGLFRIGERVFASTHGKPKQQKYSPYVSKAEQWSTTTNPDQPRPAQVSLSTWNPGLYELTVAVLQTEDNGNPIPWANLVHELRQSTLHFEDATALPLPLHLAKLMEEYILSIDVEDDDDK